MENGGIMKKIAVLALVLGCVGVFACGCGKSTLSYVKDNMSEKTEVYFFGETDEVYATLSSGEREEEYLMNGKSEKNVGFGLLTVNFYNEVFGNVINVNFVVGGKEQTLALELNPLNSTYMIDLERKFVGDEEIFVQYLDDKIQLANVSKDFAVGADKAIEIASKEISKQITKEKKLSALNAECYLRVLDKRANNFQDMFWVFTVVNVKNETYSVVISTVDGSVLSKSE